MGRPRRSSSIAVTSDSNKALTEKNKNKEAGESPTVKKKGRSSKVHKENETPPKVKKARPSKVQKENETPPKTKKGRPSEVQKENETPPIAKETKKRLSKISETSAASKNNKLENKDEEAVAPKRKLPSEEQVVKKKGRPSKVWLDHEKASKIKIDFKQRRGVGDVLTVGTGDTGQLGLGEDVMEKTRMGLIQGMESMEEMVDVCAGGMHSVGLSRKGEVWTWGCNDEGALGRKVEEEEEAFVPGKVEIEGKVVMVSAGDSHTAALTEAGKVFLWGTFRDASGPIGLVTPMKMEMKPVKILEEVMKISSGTDHLVMLLEEGSLYTIGNAEQGQLGRVGERFATRGARRGLDMLLTPGKVNVKGGKKFKDVWAGGYDTVAVTEEDKIVVMGLNNYWQLGVEGEQVLFMPTLSKAWSCGKWRQVAMGQHHGLGLDDEGGVWAIGRGEYGRLGLGRQGDALVPTRVDKLEGVKCVQVSCGEAVSYAVGEDGKCWAWGMGTNYQLATGADDDVEEPQEVKGKALEGRKVLAMYGGGQHAIMLAGK